MSWLTNLIAKLGTNPNFIAFMAHSGVAYAIVYTLPWNWWVVLAGLLAAAVKEFWFDSNYESPPQSFDDNALDFAGYATGIVLASLAHGGLG